MVRTIRDQLNLEPTGRPAKSTSSIIEKLHRETIRLSQVQDIAGCRVVVPEIADQELAVVSLRTVFSGAAVIDRRKNPSYGYRAVHVVPRISGKLIEIQVRTSLQHLWAELSEKFADRFDPSIKYGGGNREARKGITGASERVAELEEIEKGIEELEIDIKQTEKNKVNREALNKSRLRVQSLRQRIVLEKKELVEAFGTLIALLEHQRRLKQ